MAFNPVIATNDGPVYIPDLSEFEKCTVISIFPRDLNEEKTTLRPGKFFIPAGTYEKPSITVIGWSYYVRDIGQEQANHITINVPSMHIADSICRDLSMLASTPTQGPGLFWMKGEKKVSEIPKEKLDKAKERQDLWFRELIQLADVDWSRANGNPLVIWDICRLGANQLGLKDKAWLKDERHYEKVKCLACGNFNDPSLVVCPNCKVILDAKKFEAMGLKFVS